MPDRARSATDASKSAVGRLLARGWPVTLPGVAAATRRLPAAPLEGVAFHLTEGLRPEARYQVARLRFGSRMVVDLKDHVQRPLYFEGEWEPSTTALIRRSAHPGWSFLDVGANAGYYTLLAAAAGGPTSRVVAMEPNPPIHALLTVNVALNGLEDRVVVRREAAGSSPGTATLNVSGAENSGRSTLVEGRLRDEHSAVTVPVATIDALCAELDFWPSFVKVDAEGYEAEIISGMGSLLEKRPPRVVVLEVSTFDGVDEPRRVVELMADVGYRPYRIGADGALSETGSSTVEGLENLAFLPAGPRSTALPPGAG